MEGASAKGVNFLAGGTKTHIGLAATTGAALTGAAAFFTRTGAFAAGLAGAFFASGFLAVEVFDAGFATGFFAAFFAAMICCFYYVIDPMGEIPRLRKSQAGVVD